MNWLAMRFVGQSLVSLGALVALLAADACAQYPAGQGGAGRRGGNATAPSVRVAPDGSPRAAPDSPASLRTRAQLQLDRLEDELKINAAQQQAWDAYAARVMRLADDVARERFAARDTPTDAAAADQFDRLAQTAQDRAAALRAIADAARALYATLGPEQRTLADRRLAALARALESGAPLPVEPAQDVRSR